MKEKIFAVKTKNVKDDGSALIVFATLGVIDKDEDVILAGAFGEQKGQILPAHDWHHVPLGSAEIFEDGNEAIADLKFNMDIEAARNWHSAIKFDKESGNPVQEYSFGFDTLESSRGMHEERHVRFLKKLKVHEVSPVLVGAGVNTRTLAAKSGIKKPEDLGFDGYQEVNGNQGAPASSDGGAGDPLKTGAKGAIPFKDQASKALASIKELVSRAESLADIRAKDGRKIGAESVGHLKNAMATLEELKTRLVAIIESNDHEDVTAEAVKAAAQFEQIRLALPK